MSGTFHPGAYDVEGAVFSGRYASHLKAPDGLALADQRRLTDQLATHFAIAPVTVRRHNGRLSYTSYAEVEKHSITYGALAGPAIVAHEVAHLVAGKAPADGYWHGPTWQAAYVEGVSVLLGFWHATRLGKAFAAFETGKSANRSKPRGQRAARS